jgi:hypothetical protein
MVIDSINIWSRDLGGVEDEKEEEEEERGGGSKRCATLLTEWGICVPNITNPESTNTIECEFVANEADKMLESWTYWNSASLFDDEGNFLVDVAKFFVRPYPMATYGVPHNITFNVHSGEFLYEFYPSVKDRNVPTEIFVPEMHYPEKSFLVTVSSDLIWTDWERGIKVYARNSASPKTLASVRITSLKSGSEEGKARKKT